MKTARPLSRYLPLPVIMGLCLPSMSHADGLAQHIDTIFGENGVTLQVNNQINFNHSAHFSSSSLAILGTLTSQLASGAVDIPAISTVPGFTYSYNSDIQAFERRPGSLGSIYIERPFTVGRGKFDFGFSYNYVGFDTLDGQKLNGLNYRLTHADCCSPVGDGSNPSFESATIDLFFDRLAIESHIFNFSATYGITDKWDVNLLVPVIQTTLDINARAHINDVPFDPPGPGNFPNGVHEFANGTKDESNSFSGSNLGFGDIQVRTKYHFLNYRQFNMAGGLNLRLPTGSVSNFQGVGDLTVLPYLSFSQEYGILDLHAIAGVEFNTGNSDRDRIRYAGGATFQVLPNFALITDFIGTSNIRTNRVTVLVPDFTGLVGSQQTTVFNPVSSVVNNDTLDFAVGFKYAPIKSVITFFNAFIPLNDAGLRANVVPTGGVQISF